MGQKTIELRIERTFGTKISAAFDFIKQNFKGLFKPILYIALPAGLLGGFFLSEYFTLIFSSMNIESNVNPFDSGAFSGMIFNYLGLLVVMALGYTLIIASIFAYMSLYDEDKERDITYSMVFAKVKQRIGRFIGYNIVYGLVVSVALGIIMAVCFVPVVLLMSQLPILGALLYLVMIFVLIFAILFVAAYSYLFQDIIFFEDLSLGDTFSRTFKLLKGNWWSTIGLIFVVTFILNILSFIFVIPIYIVMILNIIGIEMEGLGKILTILVSMLVTFASFLIVPLIQIPMAIQYFNLVEKKDGIGMMNQIGKIGEIGSDGFDD